MLSRNYWRIYLFWYMGSDPYEIDNCLDAYNVSYTTYDSKKYASYTDACNAFDNALSTGKSSVVSFNWAYMQKQKNIFTNPYILQLHMIHQIYQHRRKHLILEATLQHQLIIYLSYDALAR